MITGRQSNILLSDESNLARSGKYGNAGVPDLNVTRSAPGEIHQSPSHQQSHANPCSHSQSHCSPSSHPRNCHCHHKSQDCVHHQKFVEYEIIPPKEILF